LALRLYERVHTEADDLLLGDDNCQILSCDVEQSLTYLQNSHSLPDTAALHGPINTGTGGINTQTYKNT